MWSKYFINIQDFISIAISQIKILHKKNKN